MKTVTLFVIFLAAHGVGQAPPPAASVFIDSGLDFRYSPPPNMRDLTKVDRQSIRQRAAAIGKTNTLTLLLSLRSGPDDAAPTWHSVGIETYPREKLGNVSDRDASRLFSQWAAGIRQTIGRPAEVQIGGAHFLVSTFQLRERQVTKYARVYTTVRHGRMLAFAFSANSPDVLSRIAESMKTFGPRGNTNEIALYNRENDNIESQPGPLP